MSKGRATVAVCQMAMGDYRRQFVYSLCENENLAVKFFVGDRYFKPSVRTDREILSNEHVAKVRNFYFFKRRAAIQFVNPWPIIKADVVVVEYNPRIITNWVWCILRKALGRRTLGWGHAWPRRGSGAKTVFLRHLMLDLMAGLIVYTPEQKKELEKSGLARNKKVFVAPNAIYLAGTVGDLRAGNARSDNYKDVIIVGRLVAEKKPQVLLRAFRVFLDLSNAVSNLHVVGDGPLLEDLLVLTKELDLEERVFFHGHVSDPSFLARMYSQAAVSVVPGFAGLSVTQSLIFGCPVVVSRDEDHAPEVALIHDGRARSAYFATDDVKSLAGTLVDYVTNHPLRPDERDEIASYAIQSFSVDAMVEGFTAALRDV